MGKFDNLNTADKSLLLGSLGYSGIYYDAYTKRQELSDYQPSQLLSDFKIPLHVASNLSFSPSHFNHYISYYTVNILWFY